MSGVTIAVVLLTRLVAGQLLPPDLRAPETLEVIEVPGQVVSDGVPTDMQVVHSRQSAQQLFKHYFKIFEDSGLFIPPENTQIRVARSIQLTGLDTESLISYTVVLMPLPDGSTKVTLGRAHLGLAKKPGIADTFVPLFPGAMNLVRSSGEGLRTLSYEIPAGRSEDVMAFYEKALQPLGFKPDKFESGTFVRPGQRIQLRVTKGTSGLRVLASEFSGGMDR